MYIKNIKINGFRNFSDENSVEVKKDLNLIISKNNVGKSNFGDLTYSLFSNLNDLWIDNLKTPELLGNKKNKKLVLTYQRGYREGGFEEGLPETNSKLSERKNKIEILLQDRKEEEKQMKITCYSLDETFEKFQDNYFKIEISNSKVEILQNIYNEILAIKAKQNISNDITNSNIDSNRIYLFDFLRENERENRTYNIPIIEKIGFEETKYEEIQGYIDLLISLADGENPNQKFEKTKKMIGEKFEEVLELNGRNFYMEIIRRGNGNLYQPKYKIFFNEGQVMEDGRSYFRYGMEKASKGMKRKVVLVLFLCLWEILKGKKEIIFFIDEPEQNLHFSAVKKFVQEIKKINEKRDMQVFISTHSAEIINEISIFDIIYGVISTKDNRNTKEFSAIDIFEILKTRRAENGEKEIIKNEIIYEQLEDLGLRMDNKKFLFVEGKTDKNIFEKIKGVYLQEFEDNREIIIQSVEGLGSNDDIQEEFLNFAQTVDDGKKNMSDKRSKNKSKNMTKLLKNKTADFGMLIDGDYKERNNSGFSKSSSGEKSNLLIMDGIKLNGKIIEVYTLEFWFCIEILSAITLGKTNIIKKLNEYFKKIDYEGSVVISEEKLIHKYTHNGENKRRTIKSEEMISQINKMKKIKKGSNQKFDKIFKVNGFEKDSFLKLLKEIKICEKNKSHLKNFINCLDSNDIKELEIYKTVSIVLEKI